MQVRAVADLRGVWNANSGKATADLQDRPAGCGARPEVQPAGSQGRSGRAAGAHPHRTAFFRHGPNFTVLLDKLPSRGPSAQWGRMYAVLMEEPCLCEVLSGAMLDERSRRRRPHGVDCQTRVPLRGLTRTAETPQTLPGAAGRPERPRHNEQHPKAPSTDDCRERGSNGSSSSSGSSRRRGSGSHRGRRAGDHLPRPKTTSTSGSFRICSPMAPAGGRTATEASRNTPESGLLERIRASKHRPPTSCGFWRRR